MTIKDSKRNSNLTAKTGLSCLVSVFWIISLTVGLTSVYAQSVLNSVADKDLAILVPKEDAHAIPAFSNGAENKGLLPQSTYKTIKNGFLGTDAEGAIEAENTVDDWSLVSARIEPCSPLFPNLATKDTLCWPELRLVLQPIIRETIIYQSTQQKYFADDRALHALYLVSAKAYLSESDANRAKSLISDIQRTGQLSQEKLSDFKTLRDEISRKFLAEVLSLRDARIGQSSYESIDLRPEYYETETLLSFVTKFKNFLNRHANFSKLHTLTAFSLPEGRMPTHSDLWVFKKFIPGNSDTGLVEANINVHKKNGDLLFKVGKTQTSSVDQDDDVFYDNDSDLETMSLIGRQVVLRRSENQSLLKEIADEKKFLVEHTSCASCHKLNDGMRANFHALSYFINEPNPSVSERVRLDVLDAKEWIKAKLAN